MNKEQILAMDPYILLSFINMKLRDEFKSFELLCDDFDLKPDVVTNKLKSVGYIYNEVLNQFISKDV